MIVAALVLIVFPTAMVFAAASDLITMRISNRITVLLVVGFVALTLLAGLPPADAGRHVLAAVLVLAVCFGFFACGWIGGGDAKLAAATALWLGWGLLLEYVLLASLIGGGITLVLLTVRRLPLPSFLVGHGWAMRLHHPETGVPYGIALAAAGLLLYPETVWMAALRS